MKYETAKIHKAHQTVRILASSIKSCTVLIAFISLWIHKREIKFSDPNWRTENSRRLWKIPNLGNIKKIQNQRWGFDVIRNWIVKRNNLKMCVCFLTLFLRWVSLRVEYEKDREREDKIVVARYLHVWNFGSPRVFYFILFYFFWYIVCHLNINKIFADPVSNTIFFLIKQI